jgi:hypothetical protein
VTTDILSTPFQPAGQAPANGSRPPAPTASVMTITPEMATAWLECNTRNRKLRWGLVDAIARDITDGNWVLNGETIKRAPDGAVIDGQHRLTGIVKAGIPVQSYVIEGLTMDVQDTVDTGAVRKLGDQLTLRGMKQGILLGSIARWAFLWEKGHRSKIGGNDKPTHSEVLTFLEAHPELHDAAQFANRARQAFSFIRPSVYGMSWWLFTRISEERASEFLEKVTSGENIGAGHPAYALRARFLATVKPDRTNERLTEHEQLALVSVAWNANREARRLARPQLPRGGLTPKNFPEPK